MDVHSVTGDPQFTDVNKTWANYTPKGDYTVKTGSPALTVGFKNFPMDSFGVMNPNCLGPNCVQNISDKMGGLEKSRCNFVTYSKGRFVIQYPGEFRATITNASGRIVKVFYGKGNTRVPFSSQTYGSGVYFITIRSLQVKIIQKVMVE
jgi:hypothetical protein